jgi:hypothetical protein
MHPSRRRRWNTLSSLRRPQREGIRIPYRTVNVIAIVCTWAAGSSSPSPGARSTFSNRLEGHPLSCQTDDRPHDEDDGEKCNRHTKRGPVRPHQTTSVQADHEVGRSGRTRGHMSTPRSPTRTDQVSGASTTGYRPPPAGLDFRTSEVTAHANRPALLPSPAQLVLDIPHHDVRGDQIAGRGTNEP